ncbi:hypothetical protein CK203_046537 [Vitis vinifera]|uniref:Uncharacterized protein n=1 Tax=Vitis vinifera TaxID=29760 RepID=A0A438ILF5_VITVI|nr:hypothetical protein CK203_046537 [Vitis vinifera]
MGLCRVPRFPRHHFSAPWGDRSLTCPSQFSSLDRDIVFASLTIVPEFFVDMSSECCRSFTVYDIQSHHVIFFSSAFRAFSPVVGVQSHHDFSVSAFRAVIGFQIDVQSRVLGFGVQSRYHFSASVFRAIIPTSLSFGVQSHFSSCRHSELPPLLSFGIQSHHCSFSVSAFRVIIGFQIDIQSHILGFGVQSRYHFSVWRSESLPSSCLGFQSHYRHLV